MTIRKDQIRKIKALQSRLKMSDADYRLLLSDEFVDTCTALTETEADRVIATLEEKAIAVGVWQKPGTGEWHGKTKYDDLGDRDETMATPKQLRLIESMWKDVSYMTGPARMAALNVFVKKIAGAARLRFLDKRGAHAVITSLITMKGNREEKKR